jgi:hypothetical protein
MSRRDGSGGGTVFGPQNRDHVVRRPATFADQQQCADEGSHHLLQERVCAGVNSNEVPVGRARQLVQHARRRSVLLGHPAERPEVVLPHQMPCRLVHRVDVEGAGMVQRRAAQPRIVQFPSEHGVDVRPRAGAKARMPFRGRGPALVNGNRRTAHAIESRQKSFRYAVGRRIVRAHHLREGVDSGIRPTGARGRDLFSAQPGQGSVDVTLDGP